MRHGASYWPFIKGKDRPCWKLLEDARRLVRARIGDSLRPRTEIGRSRAKDLCCVARQPPEETIVMWPTAQGTDIMATTHITAPHIVRHHRKRDHRCDGQVYLGRPLTCSFHHSMPLIRTELALPKLITCLLENTCLLRTRSSCAPCCRYTRRFPRGGERCSDIKGFPV